MSNAIRCFLAMLIILFSIGNVAAMDFSSLYESNTEINDEDVYEQLEAMHKAQRLFVLMQDGGSDLYAVDACNAYISDCIAKNLITWSDLGIKDGREYLVLASDCRRLSVDNARQALEGGNIGDTKKLVYSESISAWESEDADPLIRAKNLFQIMQRGPDYYTIVGYDSYIRNSVEEGAVTWSDLGLRDEIDYELVVCGCKRQSALNAWESLTNSNIGSPEEARVCCESIYAAIENGDLKEDDAPTWCTAGEIADRIIKNIAVEASV